MKKSTKIISTYVLLLLIGALTIFVAERIIGKGGQEKKIYNLFTKPLSPFSVVVAEESADFRIEMCDSNAMEWTLPKEMSIKGEPAYVRNDTLFVAKTLTGKSQYFVVRCKTLTTIVSSKGSRVQLIDPSLDKLKIMGTGGKVFLYIINYTKAIHIGQLDIVGKKTSIEIQSPLNCLNAQLDGAQLYTYSTVDEVNLKMVNNSSIRFNSYPRSRFNMEKDSTSSIKIY